MKKGLILSLALALSLLLTGAAMATVIVPTDLGTIVLGASVAGPMGPMSFVNPAPPPASTGGLVSQVYLNGATYTYVLTVTPSINNIETFTTGFAPGQFTGVAGYSFADAVVMGTGFSIEQIDGHLTWQAADRSAWDSGEMVRLFYQSTLPPSVGKYNLIDTAVGTANGYAPVPEPATMLLVGGGLLGLAGFGRKMKK